MEQSVDIFLSGILGVFAGMAILYLAIKLTVLATSRMAPSNDPE